MYKEHLDGFLNAGSFSSVGQNWQQLPGKGWSGPALLRLICQQFAGSANTQHWALVGRAAFGFRRDLVNGLRKDAEHQS